ncbi:hypothetical protein N7465_002739 [Penicillium sp. CMV-2018d]|nr:hypothetical protein N7465_002739 [Penicillium sp. CMV-2018d]
MPGTSFQSIPISIECQRSGAHGAVRGTIARFCQQELANAVRTRDFEAILKRGDSRVKGQWGRG